MKTFCFVLLCSLAICLPQNTVEGRFVFAYETSVASEGSNATFTCQDTERKLPLKITWSFQSASVGRMICENGSIAPGINKHKYQLSKSSTKLQITDLKVNDTGNYTCCIKGENGETLLSAIATLHVKAGVVFTASKNFDPSPSPTPNLSTAMKRTPLLPEKTEATIAANPPCESSFNGTVFFNERETSPSLIKVKEGDILQLKCSYCVKSSKEDTILSWYKDGRVISNGIKNHSAVLGVPVVQHNKDEGLYTCVVTYKEQNISKFITVIVNKAEPNPMLSSVLARNGSFLSVQVTWSLTAHGVFSAARVVSLKLRLLSSSEWSHQISSISQEYALYKFEHLEPSSVYILNITLHNKDKQSESRAVVFWSAASNASESDQRSLLLYQVTNRRALGVALGIIGLLAIMTITYACVTWCHSDKSGYSIPPGQQKRSVNDENDSLFARDTTSSMCYNRAFEDDKIDWMDDEIIS